MIAFATPFAVAGVYFGALAIRLATRGQAQSALLFGMVALVFGGSGLYLIARALRGKKRAEVSDELRARHPGEPWLWNPEWSSRRIGDNSRTGAIGLWVFALFWNAIAAPIPMFFSDELQKGNRFVWIGLVFPLAGIGILIAAMRATLRSLRFRESTLVLETLPAPLGGVLRGTVEVPHALDGASAVMVRLMAVEWRRSGKSKTEVVIAQEEREIDPATLRRTGDGAVIPIEISVPADAPPTESPDRNHARTWRLVVDAEVPGVDYSARFDVPVFKTAISDFRPHAGTAPVTAPLNPHSYVERSGPRGHEIHFPAFRAPAIALWSLMFSIIWLAAVAFMIAIPIPRFVPFLFGLIAIPIVMSTLELFFGSRTIIIAPDGIIVRRRLLMASERTIARNDIAGAQVTLATQGAARPYYHVDVQTKSGRRRRVAKYVRGKREAEWVASRTTKA